MNNIIASKHYDNQSVLIRTQITTEDEELLFLMAHDTDSFNKWNAGNRYYTKLILSLAEGSMPDLPLSSTEESCRLGYCIFPS